MTGTDLQGGLDHFDAAIALFKDAPAQARTVRIGNDPRVACYTTSALALWLMGYPDRAVERANAALSLAAGLEHPFTSAYARFHAGLLHLWLRDAESAHSLGAELLEIAEAHGFRIWIAAGSCLRGAARVGLGRFDDGLADIGAGMALYQELRSPPVFWPFLLYIRASASLAAGQPAEGRPGLDVAIELMSGGSGSIMLAELQILDGDIRTAMATTGSAARSQVGDYYRRAYDRACELGARMTQLRAATRLARLALGAGDAAAAMDLLGPVYASFTEGFGAADLREARDLMSALGDPG